MTGLWELRARVAHAAGWRARAARERVARTAGILRETRSAHGVGPVALAGRSLALSRRGFTLEEAYALGILDPGRTDDEVDDLVSKRAMTRLQARLNPNELWYLTEDKAVFHRHAEAVGLRSPTLYAILCQSGPGWSRTGEVIADVGDWERLLEEGLPDTFVIKPSRGYHGLEVRVIERRDGVLHELGRGPVSAAGLCDEIARSRQFHVWVVQERLSNHPDLPGDGPALQTLRIVTLVRRDGEVEVVNAQFRLTVAGLAVDNFRDGQTGNVLSYVDLRDGALGPVLRARPDRTYETLPAGALPGGPSSGTRLPLWDEIVATVTEAAPHMLPMRSIGWDVAITPDGPRIVEANIWWDPPSPQPGIGPLVARMRDL